MTMAPARADLGRVPGDRRWHPCASDPGARAWSDDYANVLGAFRLRRDPAGRMADAARSA